MSDKSESIEELINKLDEYMEEMNDLNDDETFETALYIAEQLRKELIKLHKIT